MRTVGFIIPCYGDSKTLPQVLADLREVFHDASCAVFVVDDGSSTPISLPAGSGRDHFRVHLLRHVVNLGQGAALETGRQAAVRAQVDVVVTLDADGQHRACDARALVGAVNAGADVAVGNRFAGSSVVPPGRRLLLNAARYFEGLFLGRVFGDAHNGLRALSREVAERLEIALPRMAHATGIMLALVRMKPALTIVEVPVRIRYTEASLVKGQRARGALTIVRDLLVHALVSSPPTAVPRACARGDFE